MSPKGYDMASHTADEEPQGPFVLSVSGGMLGGSFLGNMEPLPSDQPSDHDVAGRECRHTKAWHTGETVTI